LTVGDDTSYFTSVVPSGGVAWLVANNLDPESDWLENTNSVAFTLAFLSPPSAGVKIDYETFSGTPDAPNLVESGYLTYDGTTWSYTPSVQTSAWQDAVTPSPEPAGIVALSSLCCMGLIGLVWRRRK
jgi:hypothetical protein